MLQVDLYIIVNLFAAGEQAQEKMELEETEVSTVLSLSLTLWLVVWQGGRRKRKRESTEEGSEVGGARGGGRGIHRKQPDFNYGSEYRAKVRPLA